MTPTAQSETIEFEALATLKGRSQEHYNQLNFAAKARMPELADIDEDAEIGYPPPGAVGALVQRLYQASVGLLAAAVAVATILSQPTIAVATAFAALAICSFAIYVADRLMPERGVISVAIALRLTVGFAFLAVTALLVAVFH